MTLRSLICVLTRFLAGESTIFLLADLVGNDPI